MHVVVGGIIEKEGKILLVQEAQERCYKKWNIPAGRLAFKETLIEGAKREIKEETGCDVDITGVLSVSNRVMEDDLFVTVIFLAKLIKENIKYDKSEILDVKWFTYDDIINNMDSKLRNINLIKPPIINLKNNIIGPIEIINKL